MNNSILKLRLFNVGKGDHLLLELPDGSFGVVDFFYSNSKGWTMPPACVFLENLRKEAPERKIKIAFICVSHPDIDHIKGLSEFLGWVEKHKIPVERIWRYPGHDPTEMKEFLKKAFENVRHDEDARYNNKFLSPQLDALEKFIKMRKPDVEYLEDVREVSNKIGGFIKARCLAPLGKHTQSVTANFWVRFFQAYLENKKLRLDKKNVLSSVLQLVFAKFSLLFGGDAELYVWEECIAHCAKNDIKASWQADFIKISHHGSKNSSSVELWKELLSDSFTYIGISAWKSHPDKETIDHIYQAATSTGKEFRILGTGICTGCGSSDSFESLAASWIPKVESNAYDRSALNKSRSKYFTYAPNSERLISYVLTFSSDDHSVSVEKEIGTTNFVQKCVYNPESGMFPQCVV
jgi:beta-lactamase superfamily II metal-dependent hydrolase